jgi:murein DD-endopeptidase MepM/ murein hydrolase activator NlpD
VKRVKIDIDFQKVLKRFDKISWKSPKVMGGTLATLVLLSGGGYYLNETTSAAYVIINGQTVGIVENIQSGKNLIQEALEEKGASLGVVAKTHDQVEFSRARIDGEYSELTEEELSQKLTAYIEGVELIVADNSLFVLRNQEEADNLLKAYQEIYAKADESNEVTSVYFEEEVKKEVKEASPEEVVTLEQALEKLKQGNVQKQEYVVQPNDSWWLIARKNNLLTSEVLAANPGVTLDTKIKPGEKIFIEKVSPYLTVVSEGVKVDKETIPFDVVTKTDATLASGQTKVTQSGDDGEKEIKYSYVKKNDEVVSKDILDEKVLKKAVAQVVAKGPQKSQVTVAYSRGSGSTTGIGWPLRGPINSYYGYRKGEFHTGIDIGGHTGDPYVAAASGTVVSAGWNGNYGYTLVINHGNGIQTRYAHSSKLLVKAGESVSKGQTIGLVGSTGRSTGPHLHFEVIVNGDTVNPMSYLR